MPITEQAYRNLAQACHMRAAERDEATSALLTEQCADYLRRERIAKMLAISGDCGIAPDWDVLLVRLNECLTTFRNR